MNRVKFNIRNDASQEYGPIKAGFDFDIPSGYSVLVGRNDSGKSTILQYIYLKNCTMML